MTSRIASHLSVPFIEGRRPWGKGSDMIGRNCRPPRGGFKVPVWRKALVAVLSFTMLSSGVPAPAWAQAVEDAQDVLAQAATAVSDAKEPDTGSDAAVIASGLAAEEGHEEATAPAGDDAKGEQPSAPAPEPAAPTRDDAPATPADDATADGAAPAASADDRSARAGLDADYIYIHDKNGSDPRKIGMGQELRIDATYEDLEWGDEYDFSDRDYEGMAFQWYVGEQKVDYASGDTAWKAKGYVAIEGATKRTFTVPEGLIGKRLAARVVNPGGSVVWVSASSAQVTDGKTDLVRVGLSGKAKVGATLRATAFEEGGWSGEQEATAGVTYRWLAAPSTADEFAPISGATGPALTLDASLAGSHIKVEATSRNTVASEAVGPVAAAGSAENEAKLAAAITALEKDGFSGYYPAPAFGADTNLNTMIEARLEKLGVTGVASHVVSSGMEKYEPTAHGSIDTTDGASNGDIEFFFLPPVERTSSTDYTVLRRFQPTYRLTCGDATDTFTPKRTSQLPWDDARVGEYLNRTFDNVELPAEFAQGSIPEAVTKLELPFKVVDTKTRKTVASIEWTSSNAKVAKVVSSYNVASVSFTHPAAPADVVLTAKIKMAGASGLSEKTVAVEHPLSVEPRSDATVEQIERELSSVLAKAKVGLMQGGTLNPSAVSGDLKLPTPRALGIDGRVYKLSYESSDPAAIRINTYRGVVTGNLEGEEPRSATITARLTYEDVAVTRELGTFMPAVVTNAEIDAAIDFMGRVKAGYAAALLGANASPDEVMDGLDTFQSASPAEDGSIVWARTSTDCDDTGVVPVDLPGYDPMGTAQWRLFRSSRPSVVAHENLLVTQPAYNTKVRIDSTLTYKAFESLAEAHPQNIKLQQLVNQPVSAMYTVLGATGAENPEAGRTLTVNARVTGLDAVKDDGTREQRDWIPLTEVTVPAEEGATAWDVFAGLLDEAGYTYALNAAGPMSITTPDGITLDSDFNKPYRYWAFFIDGEYGQGSEGAATTCPVRDGVTIELRYLDDGVTVLPQADVIVNPDAEHPDLDAQWNGFINGGTGSVTDALTPTDSGELAWAENLLTHEEVEASGKLFASDPLIIDGKIYIVTASEVQDPETWRPIHSLARLQVVDRSTGKIEREVQLGATMDSTCRPAYSGGIIVIPLSGGYLQAVSAKTLETIWIVPASSQGQSLCTLTVHDGYVYVSMFDSFQDKLTVGGSVRRFNIRTGALAGEVRTDASGYYWAGGVMVGDHFVIGDDQGQVHVFTADLSREVSSRKIADASIRSTLVLSEGFVYAVSQQDGTLHKLIVDDAGNVEELSSVKFADTSTSTPTISGGRAFIGGFKGDWKNKNGVLAVVDLDGMSVRQVLKANGEKIPDEVKSSPLVSVQGAETYVYFTVNWAEGYPSYTSGGNMYVYRLGDDEATLMFQPTPEQAQYCMASVICDEEGNLYYTNDSGHLFKIAGNGPAQGGDGGSGGGETGGNGGETGGGQAGGGQTGGGSGNDGSGGGNDGQTGADSGNGGQTGDGNGAGGQTGGNGGQDGGSSGNNGQSGSNSNAGASGTPTAGNTNSTTPPSKIPVTGSVPAGAKPLAKGASDKKEDASQRDAAAASDSGEKTRDADSAVAPESASSARANVACDMPVPARIAFVAGAVGVTGLVASGLWMAFTRRHKEV